MTGFFLRAVGLATVLYFIFVMPIGRKTMAQAAVEVWQETHLRHALEVKIAQMRQELTGKMRNWQKTQAKGGMLQADEQSAADGDENALQAAPPDGPQTMPAFGQKRRRNKVRLRHSRMRSPGHFNRESEEAQRSAQKEPALPLADGEAP